MIPAELTNLGFSDAIVTKMKTKNPDAPYPPFMVQLQAGSDIAKFKKIKYLCQCVITIQRFRPNAKQGTQCYRCQRFGHASKNCNLIARCVKCTEEHPTNECPNKTRDLPARCCNCDQEHPANYLQCTERLKYLERIQTRRRPHSSTKPGNVNTVKEGISWAKIVSQAETQDRQPTLNAKLGSSVTHDSKATTDYFDSTTTEILQILTVIKNIKQQFTACNTMVDKVILVLTNLVFSSTAELDAAIAEFIVTITTARDMFVPQVNTGLTMVVGENKRTNIMDGIENTGDVRLHDHRLRLKQR
ncbi:unnamed protein product [Plutella xylostella]|uniref:(diamondback moth) hypothetical protein n=1 Tax=Plutella xylostella TaxID=51655 RepID=A0A8S4EHJ2_PLUXY|nr:unnamed protein product [Plutella xylostella]